MTHPDSQPETDGGSTDDHAHDDEPQKTRRGFLARAGAIGVLPGFVDHGGSTASTDDRSTPTPNRPATDAATATATQAVPYDVSVAFEREYDPSSVVGTQLAELDGDGYAIVGETDDAKLQLLRTGPEGEPRFSRTYDLGLEISRVTGLVDTDAGFVALGEAAGDRCWLASVNTACEPRWVREYGDSDGCRSLIRTAEGGYAWVADTSEGVPVAHVVDEQGETVRRGTYPVDVEEHPEIERGELSTVVQLDDGGFVLGGTAIEPEFGPTSIWLVRTDAEGNRLEDRLYGGEGFEYYQKVTDAVQTADGEIAFTGTVSDDIPYLTNEPNTEFLFATVGPDLELGTYGLTATASEPLEECGIARGTDIVRTGDGFVVAGRAQVCGLGAPSLFNVAHVIGLDRDGTVQWVYRYPEDYEERSSSYFYVQDAVRTAGGGIAALGTGDESKWLVEVLAERQC